MSRTARTALVVMAAGGFAGPAAGQSSVWYNPEPGVAATSSTLGAGERHSLFARCNALGLLEPGLYFAGGDRAEPGGKAAVAFRFDGDPETETVTMAERMVGPDGDLAVVVPWPDAYELIVSLRSADYAETGPPGGGWRRWTLRGAKAAIDRLPCMGGGR